MTLRFRFLLAAVAAVIALILLTPLALAAWDGWRYVVLGAIPATRPWTIGAGLICIMSTVLGSLCGFAAVVFSGEESYVSE